MLDIYWGCRANSGTIGSNPGAKSQCSLLRVRTEGCGTALLPGGYTRRAGAVNEEFVSGCAKPPGQFRFALCSASFEVIQFATFVALEVMVVLFAGYFVPRRVARDFDRLQPSFLNQRLDVSVHCGNPDTRMVLLCRS